MTPIETDGAFLLRVLSDGKPHNLNDILRRSFAERGCGLTVHSRAADLRKPRNGGHRIDNWKDGKRGDGSWYQLAMSGAENTAAVGAASFSAPDTSAEQRVPSRTDGIPEVPDYITGQLTLEDVAA